MDGEGGDEREGMTAASRRRWLMATAAVSAIALGSGCKGGVFTPARHARIEAIEVAAEVHTDGSVSVHLVAEFVDDTGGILPIPEPLLSATRDLVVNGQPATGTVDFETINVPVTGRRAVATYAFDGITQNYADGTTLVMPVFADPQDGSRQDPPVRVAGTLTLPEGADAGGAEAQWNGGLDRFVRIDGRTVTFTGRTPMWTRSELAVVLPPGLTPGAPTSLFPEGVAQFRAQLRDREVSNRQLEHVLAQEDIELTVVNAVVVGLGVFLGLVVLTSYKRVNRSSRAERRRLLALAPEHLSDPPDTLDPSIVGVLVGEAKAFDQDAVAGTILDLVHRKIIVLDGVGEARFVIRVPAAAQGETPSETIVLDALRARACANGEVQGPPVWEQERPSWWRAYRRDVFRRAKAKGFLERKYRFLYFGPLAAMAPMVAWPFWSIDKIWLVPAVAVGLTSLSAIPLGGWRLSPLGYSSLGRWRAFARYTRDQGNLGDVGAAGIAVWGPYLSYGVVLGVAPKASADLAPTGGREGGVGRDISHTGTSSPPSGRR